MCRIQREKTWYAGQRGYILWPYVDENGNRGFIDYQDHYSYWDHGISRYNFLRYSEQRWKLFNPRSHFQNRLRHADYIRLLDQAGFQILEQNCHHGSPRDQEILAGLRLDQRFGSYSLEDLGVRSGQILARKKLDAT